jgi:hypothetical protein
MAMLTRAQRRESNAKPRHRRKDRERLQQEPTRAPRFVQALEQALVDVGRPEPLVAEGEWRVPGQVKRLGTICGRMCPILVGWRTADELTPLRVWDQHLPGRILGALRTQQWLRRWSQVEDKRPAPRRRGQWPWGGDDRVLKPSGQPLGRVGPWSSGQEHRGRRGIDGLRRGVVSGTGTLVVPVDVAGRRPDPVGASRPCRAQPTWLPVRLERT